MNSPNRLFSSIATVKLEPFKHFQIENKIQFEAPIHQLNYIQSYRNKICLEKIDSIMFVVALYKQI